VRDKRSQATRIKQKTLQLVSTLVPAKFEHCRNRDENAPETKLRHTHLQAAADDSWVSQKKEGVLATESRTQNCATRELLKTKLIKI